MRPFMRSYATVYARNYDRLCVEVRLFMRGRIAVFHRLFHRDKYILAERGAIVQMSILPEKNIQKLLAGW